MKAILLATVVISCAVHSGFTQDNRYHTQPGGTAPVAITLPDSTSMSQVKEGRVEVSTQDLPEALQETLNASEHYRDWKQSTVYYETATAQYILHIVAGNSTRTFRFDDKGNPIDDNEENDGQQ